MIQPKLKLCSGCKQLKKIWKSDKKEKYCKECWYEIKPPEKIRQISKKMQKAGDVYSKKRVAFLALHQFCQAKLPCCTGRSTDVHHKRGRGKWYLVMSTWLAVCRQCHQWIEEHPEEAKELGLSESRLD